MALQDRKLNAGEMARNVHLQMVAIRDTCVNAKAAIPNDYVLVTRLPFMVKQFEGMRTAYLADGLSDAVVGGEIISLYYDDPTTQWSTISAEFGAFLTAINSLASGIEGNISSLSPSLNANKEIAWTTPLGTPQNNALISLLDDVINLF